MSSGVIKALEPQLFAAARAEGETPSRDKLPRDGLMIERTHIDPDRRAAHGVLWRCVLQEHGAVAPGDDQARCGSILFRPYPRCKRAPDEAL
jgi:hypothetical protein